MRMVTENKQKEAGGDNSFCKKRPENVWNLIRHELEFKFKWYFNEILRLQSLVVSNYWCY